MADLADATGLPDHAIGLGGRLGLAIGARGVGGAAAHYEPDTGVINLTRASGVGSLAHEWGHALDHHFLGHKGQQFGSQEAAAYRGQDFPEKAPLKALHEAMRPFKARVLKAVPRLVDEGQLPASHHKSGYWTSPEEMFARAFESHVQAELHAKGRENTYLVGLKKEGHELWPTPEERAAIAPHMAAVLAAARGRFRDAPAAG